MAKNLVIVESPTKAKTISKFLGKDFIIESSFGHVRDLPKSKIGVDLETFEPQYEIPARSKKRVTELKKLAKDAGIIYFATDEDREGEAISWHLAEVLKTPPEKIKRIVFHEITEEALLHALKNPRDIDIRLVDAQQTRRILDRLVGYKLSPLLWKKVARGLSAGRVQSVAVRLIVEREREIQAFNAQEYWSIEASFKSEKNKESFLAKLALINGKTIDKLEIQNQQQADEIIKNLENASYIVSDVERKETKKNPLPPFTTSTLQQEANRRLGFSAKQTMMLAQQLYEGIELGHSGAVGLITYMRTDSINLAEKFLQEAQGYIVNTFGKNYTDGPRRFKGKSKLAQEAHEAIRPTNANLSPANVKDHLEARQFKLYQLIWQRALASQMTAAVIDSTKIDILAEKTPYTFRANGSTIRFDGFLKVYPTATKENLLPTLEIKEKVELEKLNPEQHFAQPPARYSEATLVKVMEEYGIGRPSTYAPTISTIQDRGYVEKEEKRLKPTDIAFLVNDLLVEHFPNVVDYQFTAEMENDLDEIADGSKKWKPVLKDFWVPFDKNLKEKEASLKKSDVLSVHELGIDPKTKKPIYVRMGRFGPFVQLGSKDDEEKPKFAALRQGQTMSSVTLEDALQLLSLPRELGDTKDGEKIIVGVGRFGPYIKINTSYISIGTEDPYTITLEKAHEIIKEKGDGLAKTIKKFDDSDIQVLNGRYGPYITDGTLNAKMPKDTKPEDLTLEQCQEILKTSGKKKGSGRRRFTKK